MTKVSKELHSLDTLETTSDFISNKSHERQYHKALQKFNTNLKLRRIIDTLTHAQDTKKYWKTYHCNSVLLQNGNVFKGSLCRKRWCTHCCRIKTAEMTNAYKEPLMNLGPLYFVTLTRPNVKGRELKSEIKKLIKGFQKVKDNMRKNYKMKLEGMRKIEVTYNETTDTYHPHFHLIQSNLVHAEKLKELWLEVFPSASSSAQDIRDIDTTNEKSFIELFKYATKENTSDGKQYSGAVLNTIYSSLEGMRIYQTYGSVRKSVKEPTEAKTETRNFDWVKSQCEVWEFVHEQKDWVDTYGNKLVNTLEHEQSTKRPAEKRKSDYDTHNTEAHK